jgi:hypothetical protein
MEEMLDVAIADHPSADEAIGDLRRLALLLASIGIYGVVSYGVAQRKREGQRG